MDTEPLKPMKPSMWKIFAPLFIAALMIPGLGWIQSTIDKQLEADTGNELLYFPNDKMLRHFTAGLDSVVADFLWYRTVQYTGETFATPGEKFTWLEHMIRTTAQLSPEYEDPYRLGGQLLAALDTEKTGRAENAMNVLKEGLVNIPHSWRIPYEMHTIYLMNRRNEPMANVLASRYALMVAERHEPEYRETFIGLSQGLLTGRDMHEEAIELFTDRVERATDPVMRALAEKQLNIAIIEKNCDVLNQALQQYQDIHGQMPEDLDLQILVEEGLVSRIPNVPGQGEYFIFPLRETVRNTIIEQDRAVRMAQRITGFAEKYFNEHGTYPETMEEAFAFVEKKPYNYPFPGGNWNYDPETGVATVPDSA